ncbi:MAG: hypothetical protein KF745_14050, partial [Phycisphaeraceae bacterium]|nr:hypothetical protein [Phycisphaeraceae bacterium]
MMRAPILLCTGARAVTTALMLGALAAAGSCAGTNSSSPYAPQSEESRNTIEAQRLTQQAAALMDSDP